MMDSMISETEKFATVTYRDGITILRTSWSAEMKGT